MITDLKLSPAKRIADAVEQFGLVIVDITVRNIKFKLSTHLTEEQEREVKTIVSKVLSDNTRIEYFL